MHFQIIGGAIAVLPGSLNAYYWCTLLLRFSQFSQRSRIIPRLLPILWHSVFCRWPCSICLLSVAMTPNRYIPGYSSRLSSAQNRPTNRLSTSSRRPDNRPCRCWLLWSTTMSNSANSSPDLIGLCAPRPDNTLTTLIQCHYGVPIKDFNRYESHIGSCDGFPIASVSWAVC